MTKNLRKKTEQRENMERIRNSRGIPLTFKYLIFIIDLSVYLRCRRSYKKAMTETVGSQAESQSEPGTMEARCFFVKGRSLPSWKLNPGCGPCSRKVSVPGLFRR